MSRKEQLADPARRDLEVKAAGVLKAPRAFLISLFEQYRNTFLKDSLAAYDQPTWDIVVNENLAMAVNIQAKKRFGRWAFSESPEGNAVTGLLSPHSGLWSFKQRTPGDFPHRRKSAVPAGAESQFAPLHSTELLIRSIRVSLCRHVHSVRTNPERVVGRMLAM